MSRKPTYEELEKRVKELEEATAEREIAKGALLKSEEKCRTILADMEDGYFEFDLSGNLTFFNPVLCKTLGYSDEELLGMNYRQFMSEQEAQAAFEIFSQIYLTGKPSQICEWELIAKDGSVRTSETVASLNLDSSGEPIGFRGIGRDITERRQAEEQTKLHQQQLLQASKMVALGTLVSGVAHEINNPNTFIMLNTPLLKEAWETAIPILDEYLKENGDFVIGGINYSEMRNYAPALFAGIMEGSKRIKQIVEDLKSFLRKDISDSNQSVDVNSVLKSAILLLSNDIRKSTGCFSVEYGENLPWLNGNSNRLEQVLINLIQNACQALTQNRQAITISTCFDSERQRVLITVRDEGMGIPPESLQQITKPFFTTKGSTGGIGLGLSISLKIVEEFGGSMEFSSGIGKGTMVDISLPAENLKKSSKEMST